MLSYRAHSIAQLQEFVERNNIHMGEPSGINGRKNDYLAAIVIHSDSLPPKSIIPCEVSRPKRARR